MVIGKTGVRIRTIGDSGPSELDENGNPRKTPLFNIDPADLMLDRDWWYSQHWAEDWGPERRKQYFRAFFTEAPLEDGIPGPLVPPKDLPWFDAALAKRGRETAESNSALLVAGIITALTFGRGFKNVSALFIRHFYPANYSMPRISSTMKAIIAYNFGDHEDENSSFFTEMNRVCEAHRQHGRSPGPAKIPPEGLTFPPWYSQVLQAIKKDIDESDWVFPEYDHLCKIMNWDPPLRFSQFDASIVGNILLIPNFLSIQKVGMNRKKDLDAILHITAIADSGLGVKDKYNVGLVRDPGILVAICRVLALFWLRDLEETNLFMMDSMMKAVQTTMPLLSRTNGFLYFMLDLTGVKANNLWAVMSWMDKLSFYFQSWSQSLLTMPWFRHISNAIMRHVVKDIL